MDQTKKAADRAFEEAVSRALRDNLTSLQRTAEELQVAFADLVSACASSRPANVLPAMLRTRTAAGALSSRLEILSNFVTTALQPREPTAEEVVLLRAAETPQPSPAPERPSPSIPTPMAAREETAVAQAASTPAETVDAFETVTDSPRAEAAPVDLESKWAEAAEEVTEQAGSGESAVEEELIFDVSRLPREEQELHRRANRLAKVAMQDIQLLRPEAVRAGREHKDVCARLRSDLDKARKEYDRRFKTILDHPVDYFHHWAVEILGGGDAETLGDYPYPSAVLRR